MAPVTASQEDMSEFFVCAWCFHPDFVPQEVVIAVPEPEVPFVVEPPPFLRQHEIIRSELLSHWFAAVLVGGFSC